MKTATTLFLGLALCAVGASAQEVRLPFDGPGWLLNGSATAVKDADGVHLLRLRNGSAARVDTPVEDGTFEFDVRMPRVRGFVGLRFRLDAQGSAEEVYFRPHKTNGPDAIQYAPVFNGESYWQVFHDAASTAATDFPEPDTWLHVRLDVAGSNAALYLNHGEEPVLVARLARTSTPGFFALYSSFSTQLGGAPPVVDVAGFTVIPRRPAQPLPSPPAPQPVAPGPVEQWELSTPFGWSGGVPTNPPDGLDGWTAAAADPSGILLVGRYRMIIPGGPGWAVGARFTVRAEAAGTKRLDIGFSDAATVFVNDVLVYAADNRFSTNFPRRQGLVTRSQASLFVPLRAGVNKVLVIVADANGGWAVTAHFPDPQGLHLGG